MFSVEGNFSDFSYDEGAVGLKTNELKVGGGWLESLLKVNKTFYDIFAKKKIVKKTSSKVECWSLKHSHPLDKFPC